MTGPTDAEIRLFCEVPIIYRDTLSEFVLNPILSLGLQSRWRQIA